MNTDVSCGNLSALLSLLSQCQRTAAQRPSNVVVLVIVTSLYTTNTMHSAC